MEEFIISIIQKAIEVVFKKIFVSSNKKEIKILTDEVKKLTLQNKEIKDRLQKIQIDLYVNREIQRFSKANSRSVIINGNVLVIHASKDVSRDLLLDSLVDNYKSNSYISVSPKSSGIKIKPKNNDNKTVTKIKIIRKK
jgi:hypothetical protein